MRLSRRAALSGLAAAPFAAPPSRAQDAAWPSRPIRLVAPYAPGGTVDIDLVYALWEGSWEDDAVLRDKARGIFADPAKVHRVRRSGKRFSTDAFYLAEPSPQRTPVLYQAGASGRGRAFAARHAECIFVSGPTPQALAPIVTDTRRRAAENGRDPAELLFFSLATTIVGRTEEEAQAKLADYRRYIDIEGALVLYSAWTGIDFSRFALDEPVRHQEQQAGVRRGRETHPHDKELETSK